MKGKWISEEEPLWDFSYTHYTSTKCSKCNQSESRGCRCRPMSWCWLISAQKTLTIAVRRVPSVSETVFGHYQFCRSINCFFLLIWRLHSLKLAVITSHVVYSLHFSILWRSFTGAKGIETKTGGSWNTPSFLPVIIFKSKHQQTNEINGLAGLTSSPASSKRLKSISCYLFMDAADFSSSSLFNAAGANGIAVMVMYGGLCEQTDGEM